MIAAEKIYGNTPCFLGAKNISAGNSEGVGAVVYGVPWEGAVTWGDYTGCEMGPKVMRLCSARYSGYLPELDHIDVFEHLTIGDMGDVDVVPASVPETLKRIGSFADKVWETGKFAMALGGDHGVTFPIVRSLARHTQGNVGVIQLDAHYDNKPDFDGDPYARCAPFARLYECDGVRNESIVHMGIHGPRNAADNGRLANEVGATTITVRDIRQKGDIVGWAKEAYRIASTGTEAVYLTICSDILDFAFNPGGPADANGLTSYEVLTLVNEFAKMGLAGMDLVEIYPQQDANQFSAHFASVAALYALAGVIENRGAGAERGV